MIFKGLASNTAVLPAVTCVTCQICIDPVQALCDIPPVAQRPG